MGGCKGPCMPTTASCTDVGQAVDKYVRVKLNEVRFDMAKRIMAGSCAGTFPAAPRRCRPPGLKTGACADIWSAARCAKKKQKGRCRFKYQRKKCKKTCGCNYRP